MGSEVIHVLIVEDKLLVAEDIAGKLRKHGLSVAGICASGEEAIVFMRKSPADLILMDIQLAGELDGIVTVAIIKRSHAIPVIFLSDFTDKDTVQRAKKTLPENYLSKPFLELDLIRAIDLAFHNFINRAQTNDPPVEFIFVRTDAQVYVKIPVADILYLEAERAYCKIICRSKTYMLSSSMNHIADQINHPDLLKVHRSYTINVNNISAFEGNMVQLGEMKITMSKEGKDTLTNKLRFIK